MAASTASALSAAKRARLTGGAELVAAAAAAGDVAAAASASRLPRAVGGALGEGWDEKVWWREQG